MHERSTAPVPTITSCFSLNTVEASARPGQCLAEAVYRTRIAGCRRHLRVTWCRYLLVNGLSIVVEGDAEAEGRGECRVEVKPWQFWRRHGVKRFRVDGDVVELLWDLRAAKFSAAGGDPEPQSGYRKRYYVVVVSKGEIALLLGDLQKEALRKCGCDAASPAGAPTLVSRTEHLFGKRQFSTRAKLFHDNGRLHHISIEFAMPCDPEMAIRVDGEELVHIKHLQWTFRGNQSLSLKKGRLDVYWDVHGWLFGTDGSAHAVFMFKPLSSSNSSSFEDDFCLLLYAWKVY